MFVSKKKKKTVRNIDCCKPCGACFDVVKWEFLG